MANSKSNQSILVVSSNPDLREIVMNACGGSVLVDYAQSESEGLHKMTEMRPDIVVIGDIGSSETVLRYYSKLRGGWISRQSSIIIIEIDVQNDSYRILTDENLTMSIGQYPLMSGTTSPVSSHDRFIVRLKGEITQKLSERKNKLKSSLLNPNEFCLVWEQIPGPGAFEERQAIVLENAREAAINGKVCAISITDNPGGNPAIATDVICAEIHKLGIEPIVHVALRDRNRNQVESLLYQLAALNINNLLIITGDYPSNLGFTGKAKPVFDLDSVNGLKLVREMNLGLEHEIMRKKVRLAPTDFFSGVAFSPFKQTEAEVIGQYSKMKKKVAAGADFVITQVGYDVRKLHEFRSWLKENDYDIPALASVYVLSHPVARAMYENNIPGCVVTEKLLKQIAEEYESPDRGKSARLERAAKMYAIAKGFGYQGVYISGQRMSYENLEYIISRGEELNVYWTDFIHEFDYPQGNGFYYYKKDVLNGLNLDEPASRSQKPSHSVSYSLSKLLHHIVFDQKSPLFRLLQRLMQFIDSLPMFRNLFHSMEFRIKAIYYNCKDCGDCALFDAAYLCTVSQCPKDQRNGPCGGSFEGWCEVYPNEKECIWVRAYQRLKSWRTQGTISDIIVPSCNWDLWQTSSWINYFNGQDHVSKYRNN